MEYIKYIVIDLFCGAGGTTTGFEKAKDSNGNKIAKVIACVNHDKLAIESHIANFPDAKHFQEDIRTLDIQELTIHVKECKTKYPKSKLIIWASLECINFSKAKGGLPRDRDSRTLANDLERYIIGVQPDLIMIENVREFMSWGPLDDKGKPISRKSGRDYIRWCNYLKSMGYNYDYRLLNAADFGAHTSRIRYFGIFAKGGIKITFPVPTHAKKPISGIFGQLEKWKPVKEVLDFKDKGTSIFLRKKPLVERTLKRIYGGLEKYIAKGSINFLQSYYGTGLNINGIENPAPTITTKDRLAIVQCTFWLDKQYSGAHNHQSIEEPNHTLTARNKYALMVAEGISDHYLINPQFNNAGSSIEKPCFTLIARMDKKPPYLVSTEYGELKIQVKDDDTPTMKKIKSFMAHYGLVDIKMRMLKVDELKRITGFPEGYILKGGSTKQKWFIGNAVPPVMAKVLCESIHNNNL
jgi:DNA (cytosine-5)-methyltransferase 1